MEDPPNPTTTTFTPKCGRHNSVGVGVNVAGTSSRESEFAEWPHMCRVVSAVDGDGRAAAFGASLIAPGVLLTAAHWAKKKVIRAIQCTIP